MSSYIFQVLVFFYYYIPFFAMAICYLIYPRQHWIKDWTVIFAGGSLQAQFVYIWSSLKWRTDDAYQVPDTPVARTVFWTVNLGLFVLPHLFAAYCHQHELREFMSDKVIPMLKGFHGDVQTSQRRTKQINLESPRTQNGPVTRQQKKKQL